MYPVPGVVLVLALGYTGRTVSVTCIWKASAPFFHRLLLKERDAGYSYEGGEGTRPRLLYLNDSLQAAVTPPPPFRVN
ncbi:hypothetical protein E2C01_049201 [Portunus trituberculatus]|uniref:Uncharacterized protein n=1 Tax=Portunus trituberculatus TaxID=210409 RepID=A0A5B7GC86_PORTR|nr:hypothetical protein [Portunus trituberculatus]